MSESLILPLRSIDLSVCFNNQIRTEFIFLFQLSGMNEWELGMGGTCVCIDFLALWLTVWVTKWLKNLSHWK